MIARIKDVAQGGVKSLIETGLTSECLTEGDGGPKQVEVRPSTGVAQDVPAGERRIPVQESDALGGRGPQAFEPGQRILVGAGTDHAEEAYVEGYGSLILRDPLRHAHAAGETILVEQAAPTDSGGGTGGSADGTGTGTRGPNAGIPGVGGNEGPPASPVLRNVAPPRITGAAVVGRTVRAVRGRWDPGSATTARRWLLDGRPLAGRTAGPLRLPARWAGRRLSVVETARLAGGPSFQARGTTVTVRHRARLTATVVGGRLRRQGSRIVVVVRTAATRRPTGAIVLVLGRQRVRTRLRARDRGRIRVAVPRLRPGSHRVRVDYTGTRLVAPASASRTLTVR